MSSQNPDPLERALEMLLLPVVRLALKRGLAFGRFSEMLKRAYVAAARRDFTVPGRKLSLSRVAVLTGMTRKEASRLMQEDPDRDLGNRISPRLKLAATEIWPVIGETHQAFAGLSCTPPQYFDKPY